MHLLGCVWAWKYGLVAHSGKCVFTGPKNAFSQAMQILKTNWICEDFAQNGFPGLPGSIEAEI